MHIKVAFYNIIYNRHAHKSGFLALGTNMMPSLAQNWWLDPNLGTANFELQERFRGPNLKKTS